MTKRLLQSDKSYVKYQNRKYPEDAEGGDCAAWFEDQTIIMSFTAKEMRVDLLPSGTGKGQKQHCFHFDLPKDYFTEDHDTYLFIAANTGEKIPNEHVIHGIRFIDKKHLHDSEEIDSSEDRRPFTGKTTDIIRKGAIQMHD